MAVSRNTWTSLGKLCRADSFGHNSSQYALALHFTKENHLIPAFDNLRHVSSTQCRCQSCVSGQSHEEVVVRAQG